MNHLQTIPNYSTNVLKLLRIYKFYKVAQFRMNLINRYNKGKLTVATGEMNPQKKNKKIVIKDGYKFILLDGLYYKLTKKSYTKEEIERWCTGEKSHQNENLSQRKED